MKVNSLYEPFQLREIVNRLRSKDMMLLMEGSLSVLDDEFGIYITPSEIEMLNPDPDEMLYIGHNLSDNDIEGSLEINVHKAIYEARKDVRAICHAYSPALSVISTSYNQSIFSLHPRMQKLAGLTHFSEYVIENTEEQVNSFVSRFRNGASNVILDNAGVITTGRTLLEAFQKMETLDHLAKAIITANKIGELNFPNDENQRFFEYFKPQKCEGLRGRKAIADYTQHKKALVNVIEDSYNNDLVTAISGSFSIRATDHSFFVSPKGVDKKYLRNDELVFVNNGKACSGKIPDDNIWIHKAIYNADNKINAIALILPTEITAYAFLNLLPEMKDIKITRTPFSAFANVELLANLIKSGYQALLIENDLLIVTASSISELSKRLDIIGYSSRTNILSEALES